MDVYKFDIKNSIKNNEFIKENIKSIILLGEFETFHKGHLELFEKARSIKNNQKIGIFIIEKNKNFQTIENRLNNLAKIGFDFAIVADFNFELKTLEGDFFIQFLDKTFNVDTYIVGSDFKFGKDRKYGANDIQNITKNKVEIVELFQYLNHKISSSTIKQMHEFGEYNIIKEVIVNPLIFDIEIINKKILWDKNIKKPHTGIYYFKIIIDQYWYHGIIRFGLDLLIDYHLVNFNEGKNIFDQLSKIEILDIHRIITNQRFDQINNDDIEKAKKYFSI